MYLPGKFIGPHPVNRLGGKQRRNLVLLSDKACKSLTDSAFRDMGIWKESVNFLFKVIGRSGCAETYAGHILLVMSLKRLRKFGCIAYAHKKHSRSQRVESACMSDFQIFLAEMSDGSKFYFPDYIGGSPPVGFVNRDDEATGIIFYIV